MFLLKSVCIEEKDKIGLEFQFLCIIFKAFIQIENATTFNSQPIKQSFPSKLYFITFIERHKKISLQNYIVSAVLTLFALMPEAITNHCFNAMYICTHIICIYPVKLQNYIFM
ncbi:hypothetical protein FKM82_010277 [Ascaphus truei]